jgi:AcrR family transcriptional regulator
MPRPADPNARAALVAAARGEFVKKGLRGARIEDITAACGLSKGAFYLHFSSKEALFGEVVAQVQEVLAAQARQRMESVERFFTEHGQLEAKDLLERSERYERLVALETELDARTLELMWECRDVMHVLLRGSQGTEFESLFWALVDMEVERVAQDFRRLQGSLASREDVSPTLFGSVIVGTYALLVQQMSHMRDKPDLERWARELQRLFREGVMRRDSEPAAAHPPRALTARPSPRRASARALSPKTSRKP